MTAGTDTGLTQRALAVRLKIHNTMIHRSEIGDRRIDPGEFVEWCRACGVDPAVAIGQFSLWRT